MNAPTGSPDIVSVLAEFFTGQDLMLCSVAMAGPPDSTAYRRAVRYFRLREAFGVPGNCEYSDAAREHILSAFSKYVTAQGGAFVVKPPAVPKRCTTHLVTPSGEQQCARVLGHEGEHAYND